VVFFTILGLILIGADLSLTIDAGFTLSNTQKAGIGFTMGHLP